MKSFRLEDSKKDYEQSEEGHIVMKLIFGVVVFISVVSVLWVFRASII